MADTFASFNRKVERFSREMTAESTSHAIGKMAKKEAEKAASNDLGGDPKFSGWAPVLVTRYDIVGPGVVSFHPTRRSAGPWTVAEIGRNQGSAGGFSGPGLNARTGASAFTKTGKVRRRKGKRWNGRTAGKGTASDALRAIEPKVGPIVETAIGRAISKTF